MKKKLLSLAVALAMVLTLLPTMALADEDDIDEVDEEGISMASESDISPLAEAKSLSELLSAAGSSGTVKLEKETETLATSVHITSGKDITLDLNGKKFTASNKTMVIIVDYGAKLTLIDSVGTGEISASGTYAVKNGAP